MTMISLDHRGSGKVLKNKFDCLEFVTCEAERCVDTFRGKGHVDGGLLVPKTD